IGLKQHGHEVTIATHTKGRTLSEKYGLKFKLVEGDLTELIGQECGNEILWGSKGKKFLQLFGIMKEFRRALKLQLPTSLEATSDADVLIYSTAAFAGPHLGEYFSIPTFLMQLQPDAPTKSHPSSLFSAFGKLGKTGCLLSHFLAKQQFWQPIRKEINRWRQNQLKLKKFSFFGPKNLPTLITFSPHFVPKPDDWAKNVHMTSFCRIQNEKEWIPPQTLSDFLSNDKILYVGFGSLTEACHPSIVEQIVEVLSEKKIKTIISSHFPTLKQKKLPSWIYPIDYAPHDWLFRKVSAVVHHGGVGTLAAGLYAGKPTLIIPFLVDQPHWGQFIEKERLGPKPLSAFSFNKKAFEQRLDQLLTTPKYQENATILKTALYDEKDGVKLTIDAILNEI
ncbi:MAG: glycosyltransferase family 1 protein, partial [Simkaniaceae bacterium]|nr:glycosyltransferase family 1 protein [Simkaniaceae bacterium]